MTGVDKQMVETLYAVALSVSIAEPELSSDSFMAAFRRELARLGMTYGEEEFTEVLRRLLNHADGQVAIDAAYARAEEVRERCLVLQHEYQQLTEGFNVPITYELGRPLATLPPEIRMLDAATRNRVENLLARMLGMRLEIQDIIAPYPDLLFVSESSIDGVPAEAMVTMMRTLHDALVVLRVEQDRAERLERRAAARAPEPAPEPRVCVECGKKPARVGDLCKRCAHAAGMLPHGKIGEAL